MCILFIFSCIFALAKIAGMMLNRSSLLVLLKLGILFQAIIKANLKMVSLTEGPLPINISSCIFS